MTSLTSSRALRGSVFEASWRMCWITSAARWPSCTIAASVSRTTSIRVFALDRDFATLRVAGRFLGSYPEITLVQGDALALPVRAGSVDVTISALTLHHLNRREAVRYLRELDAAARLGIVVNDLVRSRVAYVLVWLTTRVLARSRIARHDGPLSVLRAYTPDEARQLCEQAGLSNIEVMHYVTLQRQCAIRRGPRSSG
jgi:hypothetical protein